MGSVYNGLDKPRAVVAQAQALGLNTVRITDFLDVHGSPRAAPYDEAAWRRVDRLIAAASAAGLHVELDFSTFRNLLRNAGLDAYSYNWGPFLRMAAARRNTLTGVRYRDDPTIALVAFAGEADAPNGNAVQGLTTLELTDFYRRVEQLWDAAAPRQLLTAGGLDQLDWESGIDWQSIFDLPHNDIDAVHIYSIGDRERSVPAVAAYSRHINRPWITEECGFTSAEGDRARAADFARVFQINNWYGSAGVGIWNVGPQTRDTSDVGPQFPLTFAVVSTWTRASGAVSTTSAAANAR